MLWHDRGERKFLGFSFTNGKLPKRRIAPKTKTRFEARIRILTRRTRGISIETMVRELGRYLQGWQGYFGFCQTPTVLDRFNKWIRRRIRSAACKQWQTGKTRFARLRELGLSHDLAARTAGASVGSMAAQPHRSSFLCHARRFLRSLGTSLLALHTRRLILPSRRVRTRTHGGVTGKASDRLPMSIPWLVFSQRRILLEATMTPKELRTSRFVVQELSQRSSCRILLV